MLTSASVNPLKANNSQPLSLTMLRILLSIVSLGVLGSQVLKPQVLQQDAPMEQLRQRAKPVQQSVTSKTKILTALGRLDAKGAILKCL
jgi:hypothetical protein